MDTIQAAFLYRDLPEPETENLTDYLQEQDWVGDLGRMESKEVPWRYLIALDDPCLMHKETVEAAKQLSQKGPLLFFVTTDEYACETEEEESDFSGWGFRVFHQNEEKARVEFSYGWPSYGDVLKSKLEDALGTFDATLFELFALEKDRLEALQQLLDPVALFTRLEGVDTLEEIERNFTRLLEIESDFLGHE